MRRSGQFAGLAGLASAAAALARSNQGQQLMHRLSGMVGNRREHMQGRWQQRQGRHSGDHS